LPVKVHDQAEGAQKAHELGAHPVCPFVRGQIGSEREWVSKRVVGHGAGGRAWAKYFMTLY
jgi:hypothetical protein